LVVSELEVKMQMAQQNWKNRCRLSSIVNYTVFSISDIQLASGIFIHFTNMLEIVKKVIYSFYKKHLAVFSLIIVRKLCCEHSVLKLFLRL